MDAFFQIVKSPWLWIGLTIFLLTLDYLLFILIPLYAKHVKDGGDRKRAIRMLEFLCRLPVLGSDEGVKLLARYRLAICYFQEGRFPESAPQFELCLRYLADNQKAHPGLVADIRRRLGDCHDAMGYEAHGAAERNKASQAVQGRGDFLALKNQGDLLKRENRYDEALALYNQALAVSQKQKRSTRAEIMVSMCLAAFEGGHPDQTIYWAEAAIAEGATGFYLRSAHSMAGIAYGNRADLERAEQHTQMAYQLAYDAGDKVAAGRMLAMLGSLKMRRGHIDEALNAADQSISTLVPTRTAYVVKGEALQAVGRFEEARIAMLESDKIQEGNIAFYHKRQHGMVCFALARIMAEEKELDEALNALQEAAAIFREDAKLSLWCDAMASRILAPIGKHDEARSLMEKVEQDMGRFPEDRNSSLICLSSLARAAFEMTDYAQALVYWKRYLAEGPDVVWRPNGLYFVGECRRHLGDQSGAREAFETAASLGLDTYYTRLARQALHDIALL